MREKGRIAPVGQRSLTGQPRTVDVTAQITRKQSFAVILFALRHIAGNNDECSER
jgi:hypothetical protein